LIVEREGGEGAKARLNIDLATEDKTEGAGEDGGRVTIDITVPKLSGLDAELGSRVVVTDLKNESFSLRMSDSARLSISGSAASLIAILSGDSEVDASHLRVETANVQASGRSRGWLDVTKALALIASGESQIETLSNPAQVNKLLSGRSRLIE